MKNDRFQNFFLFNGVKYYTGTIIIINHLGKQSEGSFICYDTEYKKYIYKINESRCQAHLAHFQRNLIKILDKHDPNVQMPRIEHCRDTEINGLFIGWLIYVFLAFLCIIAKNGLLYLIFLSVLFFAWRAKKIKEEGTYIVW